LKRFRELKGKRQHDKKGDFTIMYIVNNSFLVNNRRMMGVDGRQREGQRRPSEKYVDEKSSRSFDVTEKLSPTLIPNENPMIFINIISRIISR